MGGNTYFIKPYMFIVLAALAYVIHADNPIISQRYTADPNAFIFEDRVYVMCTSDEDNVNGYKLYNYTLISSDDMVNWTDHNLVFQVQRDTKWGGQAYAPAAITRNGKVYLCFPNGTSGLGMCVADKPEGPYKDIAGRAIVNRNTPNCSQKDMAWLFDPGLFIDNTGNGSQAYLVFGGGVPHGNNLAIVKLKDDMKTLDGDPKKLQLPDSFEGPFLHKYKNKYYLSYPTTGAAKIDYVMSDNPMSGWVHKGTILPNPTLNGKNINLHNNSHESIIEYKGQWYMFYHDRRLSNKTYKRNACVDILKYNDDGTIQKVIVTAEGPPQIKKLNPYETIQAETIWKQSGIETDFCDEGGVMLTHISNGDYTSLKGVDFKEKGAKTFEVRASSGSDGGTVEVHLDKPDGKLVASCTVSKTGGWKTWKTFSCDVTGLSGVHNIYFVFKGSNEPYRLNWFRFIGKTVGMDIRKSFNQNFKGQKSIEKIYYPASGNQDLWNGTMYDLAGKKIYSQLNKFSSVKSFSRSILILKRD
ncbi:MAG: glycoside hydrolase family 43 protein [Chitinispirillia bacterium]